jgi:sec-independent protein translocase protein TatB
MFGMSWWEFSIIGLAIILVLGPNELPHAMRQLARFMKKARRLASEFQGHMDDLVREAELDEVRRTVTSIKNKDIGSAISQAVDPTGEYTRELNETLSDARSQVADIKTSAGHSPGASAAPKPQSVTAASKPALPDSTQPGVAVDATPPAKTDAAAPASTS